MMAWAAAAIVFLAMIANVARADFTAPADGKFTESQLITFLDAQKDWLLESSKILSDAANAKNPQDKAAAVRDIDNRYGECLEQHHLSRQEFEWMGRQAQQAWGAETYLDGAYRQERGQIDEESKEIEDGLAGGRQRLAEYQSALKNGSRALNQEERDVIVKAAQDADQAALEDAKERGDDAAAVEAEAKQHDDDASVAEAAAANPPTDLSGDDRTEYIQNKKREAAAALDSAKEARNQAASDRKDQADAQIRADAATQQAAHPEIPVGSDDIAQAKSDDENGVADATKEISVLNARKTANEKALRDLEDEAKRETQGAPAENVAIMGKHADRYREQVEAAARLGATTRGA